MNSSGEGVILAGRVSKSGNHGSYLVPVHCSALWKIKMIWLIKAAFYLAWVALVCFVNWVRNVSYFIEIFQIWHCAAVWDNLVFLVSPQYISSDCYLCIILYFLPFAQIFEHVSGICMLLLMTITLSSYSLIETVYWNLNMPLRLWGFCFENILQTFKLIVSIPVFSKIGSLCNSPVCLVANEIIVLSLYLIHWQKLHLTQLAQYHSRVPFSHNKYLFCLLQIKKFLLNE